MSWYVGLDGRQIWADRDESVFTVGEAESAQLPVNTLSYLSVNSQKAVYQEHIIEDEASDSKNKKKKEKVGGRQRGYIVRSEQCNDRFGVQGPMQPVAAALLESGAVSRVDVDSEWGSSKKGKKEKLEEILPPLGPNECRLETHARCQHFAHGRGFSVDVLEGGSRQRLHCFTTEQEVLVKDWHRQLVAAVQAAGGRAVLGRMIREDGPPGEGNARPEKKKDKAREDEDDWLNQMMGRCMVAGDKEKAKAAEADQPEGGADGEEGGAPAEKPKASLPPWLRTRKR